MAIHGREKWCCGGFSSICVSSKYAGDSNLKEIEMAVNFT